MFTMRKFTLNRSNFISKALEDMHSGQTKSAMRQSFKKELELVVCGAIIFCPYFVGRILACRVPRGDICLFILNHCFSI